MPVTTVKTKQQIVVNANLDFATFKGINLGTPTAATDAATKGYVDAMKQALDIKDSVRAATRGDETYTISGGAVTQITGPTVDGVTLAINDRILIKNAPAASGPGAGLATANTDQAGNGIYTVTGNTTNLTVARAIDADVNADVTAGLFVFVTEGSTQADNGYVLTTNDAIAINSTTLIFSQFSGAGQITAGAGLTKNGNQIDVGTASVNRIVVNLDNIDLATVTPGTTASSQIRKIDFDSYGRVSQVTNAVFSDIQTTIGSQTANTVLAAPNGAGGNATFRTLVSADIPNLDTSKITTGILGVARGGTGVDASAAANGRILIGNGTGFTLANITAGSGITINNTAGGIEIVASGTSGVTTLTGTANQVLVNGTSGTATAGAITLTLPQNIHTSATPTFAGLTITAGAVTVSTPYKSSTQTWNAAGVSFLGEQINITDTTSLAASRFVEYQVAGVARFSIRKDGAVTTGIWNGTTVAVDFGGTGRATATAYMPIVGGTAATGAHQSVTAGSTTGQALLYQGASAVPAWGAINLADATGNIVTGVLRTNNGGTGINASAATNGQLLIGNGSGFTLATLTGSTTVSVTNASGSITLAVATGSTGVVTAPNYVVREAKAYQANGIYTLSNTPIAGTEHVYVNGVLQNAGSNDYAISGATITFQTGAVPESADIVLVSYLK